MLTPVELTESERRGNEQLRAYREFQAADEAWSAELQRLFGKCAGDVRYTKQGEGEPGSVLRQAHDAFHAARKAWNAAYGRD